MKPDKMPNPSQVAIDKFEELEFEFPEAGMPEDAGMPELPEMLVRPTAPTLPVLTLPEQAVAEFDIPAAELPIEIFDIV